MLAVVHSGDESVTREVAQTIDNFTEFQCLWKDS